MQWTEIWKIVWGVLVSVGGISGIILTVIKFSSNIIAKRLEERYTLKLNKELQEHKNELDKSLQIYKSSLDKELQKYKSNLDNKIYISKTKFDAEFSIYRELSKAFFEMVKAISLLTPSGIANYPADKQAKKEYENKLYDGASKATVVAQDTLNSNAPFISNNLFNKYDNILVLCKQQLSAFERRWNMNFIGTPEDRESFSMEEYQRTSEIKDEFEQLNEGIRKYLSMIDVLD